MAEFTDTISDSVTNIDDGVTTSVELEVVVSDAIGVDDSFAYEASQADAVTDAVSISDTLQAGLNFERLAADSVVADELLTYEVAKADAVADAVSISDTLQAGLNFERLAADSVVADELLTYEVAQADAAADGISVADSLQVTSEFQRSAVESVFATDSVAMQATLAFSIANVVVLSATRIRIVFAGPASLNDALTKPLSYTCSNVSARSVDVMPLAVSLPSGQPQPSYVELETTEHTNNAVYEVALTSAIRGAAGEIGDMVPAQYLAIGAAPKLQLALAISATEVEVHFNESIADNAAANDSTNYVWDGGLSTVAVRRVVGNVVTLQTTAQIPGHLYTLTVLGVDGITIAVSDSVSVADEIIAPRIFAALVVDTIALSDSVGAILTTPITYLVDVADAVVVTDEIVTPQSYSVIVLDTLALSDTLTAFKGGIAGDIFGVARDEAYSSQLTFTGAVGAVSWAIISGALPVGLAFSAGLISGRVPQNAALGDYTLTITATDSVGNSASRTITISVGRYAMLLHMNGANLSTVFSDETGKVWTRFGDTKIVTDAQALGGAAASFDGSGDYLSTPDHSDFAFGTDDFTFECFVRIAVDPTGSGQYPTLAAQRVSFNSQHAFSFLFNSTYGPKLVAQCNDNATTASQADIGITVGQRTHVACTKRGNRIYWHIGGVTTGGAAAEASILDSTATVLIGRYDLFFANGYLNGTIDEIRIMRGGFRYTENVKISNIANIVESDYSAFRKSFIDAAIATDSITVQVL